MNGIIVTIRTWWDQADRNQRAISLGGIGLLVLLLLGTFLFASRPHYALLYTDMNEADKGAVVQEIQTMGIAAKYDVPGEIEVPADKIEEVNMHLASTGKMPKNVHLGMADLDKMNLMATPAQEKVRLQGILEGELAKTIETLDGVAAARVHITAADDGAFATDHKPASAAVTITESGTGHLNSEQGRAIATLLQDSVPNLDADHITVLNERMDMLYNGEEKNQTGTAANAKLIQEQDLSHTEERELQSKLDQIYGPGSTVVSVHTILNLDTQSTKTTTETPTDPISISKTGESMTGGPNKALGVVGQAANTAQPVSKDNNNTSSQGYKNESVTTNMGTSTIETSSEKAPGTIESMDINVIADSKKIDPTAGQTSLKSIVDGEIKNRADDGAKFTDNLTFVAFDTTTVADANNAASAAATQSRIQQLLSVLPIGALLLIAVMVMKQIAKFAKAQTAMVALPDGGTMSLSMHGFEGGGGHESGAANILAAIEGLNGTGLAHGSGGGEEDLDIEDIKNKVHVPLEQLKKMANERPQMVSMLIKSLLLEDRH